MTSLVVAGDVGGPDWYHVGDEAMLAANLVALRRLRPDAVFTVISREPAWTSGHYGVRSVAPFGFGGSNEDRLDLEREILAHVDDAWRTGSIDPGRAGAAIIHALANADALVLSGGGNLCSRWPEHVHDRATLVEAARRLGRPAMILGQTIGPDLDGDDRARVVRALSQAALVGLRGRSSVDLVRSLGVDRTAIVEQLDDAWFLDPAPSPRIAREVERHERPWIAATLAPLDGDPAGNLPVLRSFGRQLAALARATDADLVFVPHWNALAGTESDALVARRLFGFLDLPGRVTLLPVHSAEDTCWLTRRASLVVSSRYHPLVFGLSGGVPGVGIHRGEHTRVRQLECLGQAGLDRHAVAFEDAVAGGLLPAALEAWHGRAGIARQLASRADAWRAADAERWSRVAGAIGWPRARGPALPSRPAPLEAEPAETPAPSRPAGGARPAALDVSAVVLTRNGAGRLEACLKSIAESGVAHELVVFVDEASRDDSEAIARRFTPNVRRLGTRGYIEPSLPDMAAACSGEFVLRIDDDETLGGAWDVPTGPAPESGAPTHFLVPRRWIVPGRDQFISQGDWFPDLQLRLFRNDPSLIHWPADLHEPLVVDGPGAVLWDRWIDHHVLWQAGRAEREGKCAAYQHARPGKHLSHFYLWEEQAVRLSPCGPYGALVAEPLDAGSELTFGAGGHADAYLLDGWSHAEPWGTWTDGPVATLRLPLRRPARGAIAIEIEANAFVRPACPVLEVSVACGAEQIACWRIDAPDVCRRAATIPEALAADLGVIVLTFRMTAPRSPRDLGESADARRLGLGLHRLRVAFD